MTKSPSTGPTGPPKEAVLAQLEKIVGSEEFSQSQSLKRFLQYVVERALDGEADQLKEYNVAVEVLGRGKDYDPRTDTIVRVQATRLRSKLNEYYRTQGSGDSLRIEIPKGSYVPTFQETGGDASDSSSPGFPRPVAILWSVAAVVVLALAAFWISSSRDPDIAAPPGAIRSIAVLPFTDMSQLKDQEFFGDGIAEELTNTLTQLQGLYVAPRTSAFQFKGRAWTLETLVRDWASTKSFRAVSGSRGTISASPHSSYRPRTVQTSGPRRTTGVQKTSSWCRKRSLDPLPTRYKSSSSRARMSTGPTITWRTPNSTSSICGVATT